MVNKRLSIFSTLQNKTCNSAILINVEGTSERCLPVAAGQVGTQSPANIYCMCLTAERQEPDTLEQPAALLSRT